MKIGIVGGLTLDRILLPDGTERRSMGGGGYYCSLAARMISKEVVLQTVAGDDLRREWIVRLEDAGVKVICQHADRTLAFVNKYASGGKRMQMVSSRPSRGISVLDNELLDSDLIHVTPVMGEVQRSLAEELPKERTSVEVQGFVRTLSGAEVEMKFWEERDLWLQRARFVNLSMEELGYVVRNTILEIVDDLGVQVASLTGGSAGAYVLSEDTAHFVPAYPVEELDPTGCGDVFSIVLASLATEGRSLLDSALVATSASSYVAEKGGLDSFPSAKELESRALKLRAFARSARRDPRPRTAFRNLS